MHVLSRRPLRPEEGRGGGGGRKQPSNWGAARVEFAPFNLPKPRFLSAFRKLEFAIVRFRNRIVTLRCFLLTIISHLEFQTNN